MHSNSVRAGLLVLAAALTFAARAEAQTRIISGLIPYCVSAAGGNSNAGTALVTWFCTSGADESFTLTSNGEIHVFDKCVDVAGAKGNDGDRIVISACNGAANRSEERRVGKECE